MPAFLCTLKGGQPYFQLPEGARKQNPLLRSKGHPSRLTIITATASLTATGQAWCLLLYLSAHFIHKQLPGTYLQPHFTEEETQAQKALSLQHQTHVVLT